MGDNVMLYLVDLDCTVADFMGSLLREHNKLNGTNLCKEDINRWDLDAFGIDKSTWQKPGFFYGLEPIEGAVEVLWKMYQNGHKIWIATNSMGQDFVEEEKEEWVKKYIPFVKGIIFTANKHELPADVLIDDCPEYLEKFTGTTIKMNQPYNKHIKADYSVNNWQDVDRLVN